MFARKKTDLQLQNELMMELGEGPMRFGPVRQECSVQVEAQQRKLSEENIYAFARVKAEWETMQRKKEGKQKHFTNEQILRIVIFCSFDVKRSLTLMKRNDPRHFNLSAISLQSQLETQTLFPCPGLKTSKGSSVFYMRPSRYFPKETPVSLIIDNLVFVMDKLALQKKHKTQQGISFLANMEGWTMSNFSYDYCLKFMHGLQGRNFPAKVDLFLILNPPAWFGKVWAIMKPMLSTSFRKKVYMINDDELPFFMQLDYEKFLPDDVWGGQVKTDELVRDFVLFHQALERATTKSRRLSTGGIISRVVPTGAILRRETRIKSAARRGFFCTWRGSHHKYDDTTRQDVTENSQSERSYSRIAEVPLSQ